MAEDTTRRTQHLSRSMQIDGLAVFELLKPITWFAPIWAFLCGVLSSGVNVSAHIYELTMGAILVGPLVCGMSQAANDWFDRHVDAINEPDRPIPSGRLPGQTGLYVALLWTVLSLLLAAFIGPIVLVATVVGIAIAWAYSAPPFRFKQNGWNGNTAVALGYEGMPWITGAAVMLSQVPRIEIFVVALLYSIGAHGIMTLNDFKAIEGDKKMGIRSLPVQLGSARAAKLACWVMALPQAIVIGLFLLWQQPVYAAGIGLLLIAQIFLMAKLLSDPRKLAPWYNATGVTLYVLGMLVAAIAISGMPGVS